MKKQKLTRRKFITLASMGVAGTYLALDSKMLQAMMGSGGMGGGGMGGGGMGGGGMGGGTTIIDPPAGAAFVNPPEAVKNSQGVFEITARQATVNVNGTKANLLTYNGTYPGPTIRANSGDTLKIKLTNSLPSNMGTNILGHPRNITNLHTHGLHVSPNEPADAMMVQLKP